MDLVNIVNIASIAGIAGIDEIDLSLSHSFEAIDIAVGQEIVQTPLWNDLSV